MSWLDECPVISVPSVLALPHITASGRREEGDFMSPCSKGPHIFKVPLSCWSVPEFLASCSYQIPLLLGRALINDYYLLLSSACSSPILLFSSQLPAACFPFQWLFLGYLPVARGSSYTQSNVFLPWKSPSLDCYFFPGSASIPWNGASVLPTPFRKDDRTTSVLICVLQYMWKYIDLFDVKM